MHRIAKHLAILLVSAASIGAEPAMAQSQPGSGFTFAPIRCAGASALCAWKRIPGSGGWQGFEALPYPRVKRRRAITPQSSP